MASAVQWVTSNRTIWKHLFPVQNGALSSVCHKSTSTYSSLPEDYNCKVELALTADGRTIVCHHPSVDIPYEHTKVSLCSFGAFPGTHSVAQAGLELTEIYLALPPECWD
uniref:Large ribosomal subunit protein mL42 n=1 Tax=Peromyscus maniculatus bairdii TaxID=230844 RepID=A0A8C8U2E8_PERMB